MHNSGLPAAKADSVGVRRLDGGLGVALSPFRHGPDEYAEAAYGSSQLILERNGEEVATEPADGLWVDVPADAAQYKMSLDTARELKAWKYSTQVKSVWSFKSLGGEDEVMPLVLADLDLPQADELSRVTTGDPIVLTLGLRHQAGSGSRARFTSATLELSYDGKQWTKLPLTKIADGKYTTTLTHPAARAGESPSLKLTGTDSAGGKLEQQITKAYGLR